MSEGQSTGEPGVSRSIADRLFRKRERSSYTRSIEFV